MQVKTIPVGELETNCYIVSGGDAAVVIDPGAEAEKILNSLGGRKPSAVLLTHGHFDHIGAAARIAAETGAKIYIHESDAPMITDQSKSLGFMTGEITEPFVPDFFVNDGDELVFGSLRFTVLHTPGHSGGGACYCLDGAVFGGDLIFRSSIGRFDYGSFTDETASVRRVLSSFPDETVIYPGHGPSTTVGYEKMYNPYVKNGGVL